MKKYVFFISVFAFIFSSQAQTTWYVKEGGAGTQSGTSFANAAADLQEIINVTTSGDSVFIQGGIYKPNRRADDVQTITPNDLNNALTRPEIGLHKKEKKWMKNVKLF